jgi:hypothetical protein
MTRQKESGIDTRRADTLDVIARGNGVAALDPELAAYRRQANRLEMDHLGKWVVFKDATLIGVHNSFDDAAKDATSRFGRGPYLIRQVGAPRVVIPASIAYRPSNAKY